MNNILSYIDDLIESFFNKEKHYPSLLIMNSITKNKAMAQYKEDLKFVDCNITEKEDNYKGIKIQIDETETIVSVK